jgi:hypothetical protein
LKLCDFSRAGNRGKIIASFSSVEGSMTQQPPAKTAEQTLQEESSANEHPSYTKPTLKKLGRKPPDDLSEEFSELLGH